MMFMDCHPVTIPFALTPRTTRMPFIGVYERGEGELKAGDVWGRDVFVK
jgi:hypothetical protein